MRKKIKKWWPFACLLVLMVLFLFRKPITQNKYSKAKMKIFETWLNDNPEDAKVKSREILDSLMHPDKFANVKVDSSGN